MLTNHIDSSSLKPVIHTAAVTLCRVGFVPDARPAAIQHREICFRSSPGWEYRSISISIYVLRGATDGEPIVSAALFAKLSLVIAAFGGKDFKSLQ